MVGLALACEVRGRSDLSRRRAKVRVPLRSSMSTWLALLAVVGLAACGSDGSAGTQVVPEDHAAVRLQAMGSLDEAVAAAQDGGIDFVCGTFSVPGRSDGTDTSACMVSDQGMVAVISFDGGADLTYVVAGSAVDGEVTVPVDDTDVYGVEAAPGQLTLSVEAGDTAIGTVSFGT